MIHRIRSAALLGLVMAGLVTNAGCTATYGPRLGLFAYPIPVSPYFQYQLEDKAWEKERYSKVPILDPLVPGAPQMALDEPSDDEVMRTLEHARPVKGGIPFLHEVQHNNVRITKESLCDSIDPPRVYPLVGPAQLHHCRWKCTIYFTEVRHVGWPIPYTFKKEDAQEVVYIDHDHLHMVGNVAADGAPAPKR